MPQRIAIIGAGLAAAQGLSGRSHDTTVVDEARNLCVVIHIEEDFR